MPRILLCNDDGYDSAGLHALKNELDKIGEVFVFAPTIQRSWISKMISRYDIVSVKPAFHSNMNDQSNFYSVSGSPSDSCLIGAFNILDYTGKLPDLIVSGINTGANMGLSFILSSGTIAVSMEAAMMGIPSMAVSQFFQKKEHYVPEILNDIKSYEKTARFSRIIAEKILKKRKFPKGIDFIIINVPYNVENFDYRITRIARIHYGYLFKKIGADTYKFNDKMTLSRYKDNVPEDSDVNVLLNYNKISITPINLDLTGDMKKLIEFLGD
ncbi:MAG: 5'/3'-nucleotidase SurE [Candidatus Helarchaeota archaeon]